MKIHFKGCLVIPVFFLTLFFVFGLLFRFSSLGYFEACYYTFETWKKNIIENEESNIYPNGSPFLYGLNGFYPSDTMKTNDFFWINFKNSKSDFEKLDSLLKGIHFVSKYLNKEPRFSDSNICYLNFCWNTKDVICKLYDKDFQHQLYVGLFDLSYIPKKDDYLIVNFSSNQHENGQLTPYFRSMGNINLSKIKYNFDVKSNIINVKDIREFNFIFWEQAQSFINSKYGESKAGKKFRFYCNEKFLAEFDYDNFKGYRITF
jgi:hypothetical protein